RENRSRGTLAGSETAPVRLWIAAVVLSAKTNIRPSPTPASLGDFVRSKPFRGNPGYGAPSCSKNIFRLISIASIRDAMNQSILRSQGARNGRVRDTRVRHKMRLGALRIHMLNSMYHSKPEL